MSRPILIMYTSGDYDSYGVQYTILCDPDVPIKEVDIVLQAFEAECEVWTEKTREVYNALYHEMVTLPCKKWKTENPEPVRPERRGDKQTPEWQSAWKEWNSWRQRETRFHAKKRKEHTEEYDRQLEEQGLQMPDLDKMLEQKFGPDRAYVPDTEEIHRSDM